MHPLRVYVVDDHPICRRGLAAMVASEPTFQWVGEAASGREALDCAPAAAPDLVLLDMVMPAMDGLSTMLALRPALPRARWVLLTCTLDVAAARRAFEAGASCVLLKTATPQELLSALKVAWGGGSHCSAEIREALAASQPGSDPGADLTQRERELLALLARGLGNGDISARLAIAIPTVKFHITNILSKLQAANRTAAVLVALRHRLVDLDQPDWV